MNGGWRRLIALVGAVVFLGALAGGVVLSGRSLIVIDNRGDTPLTLEVETTKPGDFAWRGEMKAGQRVFRVAKFTGDGSVRAVCRDGDALHRTTGGYVSAGWPHRVDITAASCAAVRIDAETIP